MRRPASWPRMPTGASSSCPTWKRPSAATWGRSGGVIETHLRGFRTAHQVGQGRQAPSPPAPARGRQAPDRVEPGRDDLKRLSIFDRRDVGKVAAAAEWRTHPGATDQARQTRRPGGLVRPGQEAGRRGAGRRSGFGPDRRLLQRLRAARTDAQHPLAAGGRPARSPVQHDPRPDRVRHRRGGLWRQARRAAARRDASRDRRRTRPSPGRSGPRSPSRW